MLKLHADKLLLIRSQSATYHELVLRNYAYMRDARKERFYNQKLNRNLWSFSDATPATPVVTRHKRAPPADAREHIRQRARVLWSP
jgi:hypothetical protein